MVKINAEELEGLGERLVLARKAAGKTQEEVAAHLLMSRPTYIAIEKGSRPATASEIVQLAAFLGRSVAELVRHGKPIELEPHLRAAIGASSATDRVGLESAIAELQRFAEDYRELEEMMGLPLKAHLPSPESLPTRGGYSELAAFAEDLAARERGRLRLGDQPILNLRQVLENEVGLRIVYAAMPSRVSGMYAYVQHLGCCVMINQKHPVERRRTTLSHEYGHVLTEDRYKSGVNYVHETRKPVNERFSDTFGMAFLMPAAGVRKQFHEIVTGSGDFKVADLVRIASFFAVSVQAMTLRLEAIGLLPTGTWASLKDDGFRVDKARKELGFDEAMHDPEEPLPERYRMLALRAFHESKISEGELARIIRVDRIRAREIAREAQESVELGDDGEQQQLVLPFGQSLVHRIA